MERITVFDDEKFLRQKSLEVDFTNDNLFEYIKELKDYCSKNSVYALAPVQIGIPKRMIYIKNSSQDMANNSKEKYDESIIYINPKIISQNGYTKFLEGCESCSYLKNDIRYYCAGVIGRPYSVEIEYSDINGNSYHKTIEGFEATVFCHEYDHLNGILHMDKTNKIFDMTSDQMKEYRENHKYEIVSKTGDYSSLLESQIMEENNHYEN